MYGVAGTPPPSTPSRYASSTYRPRSCCPATELATHGRETTSSRRCEQCLPTAPLHARRRPSRSELVSITITHTDKIAILNLGDDENRFSLGFLDEVNGHLDDIASSGAGGLVTTGTGKFYSNGLD